MRRCSRCYEMKEMSAFYNVSHYHCKICRYAREKERLKKSPRARKLAYARHIKWLKSDKGKAWRRESYRRSAKQQARSREQGMKYLYGIDIRQWELLFESQNGCCAGCDTALKHERTTHVDHNHQTNKIRGLLCRYCNLTLGHAKEDVNRLRGLLKYLDSSC